MTRRELLWACARAATFPTMGITLASRQFREPLNTDGTSWRFSRWFEPRTPDGQQGARVRRKASRTRERRAATRLSPPQHPRCHQVKAGGELMLPDRGPNATRRGGDHSWHAVWSARLLCRMLTQHKDPLPSSLMQEADTQLILRCTLGIDQVQFAAPLVMTTVLHVEGSSLVRERKRARSDHTHARRTVGGARARQPRDAYSGPSNLRSKPWAER